MNILLCKTQVKKYLAEVRTEMEENITYRNEVNDILNTIDDRLKQTTTSEC